MEGEIKCYCRRRGKEKGDSVTVRVMGKMEGMRQLELVREGRGGDYEERKR